MNLHQLRIIRETVRCNFNLTDVANAIYTSQSGVSKHIRDLEDELGVELFVRRGKRLLGLTEPGKELITIAERMLLDAKNIKRVAEQFSGRDQGSLSIATTHTQARYALPRVVTQFKARFPKVHLVLHQASPQEIATMLLAGDADVGIATEALENIEDITTFPFYSWHHGVVVPAEHPLAKTQDVTLAAIAEYPIITYHEGFTGRQGIDRNFANAGIAPDIVMSALDSDVIKTYVELGLGIGIVASIAFHPTKDVGLRLLDCRHLFDENTTKIAVRKGHYLRDYAYRFISDCAPMLDEATVRRAVRPNKDELE